MKLFAPKYYKEFKCIASRCRHSCCIGWEIDVDEISLLRYSALADGGKEILSSIDFTADVPHFILGADNRCPHLDSDGLCRIISKHGEGYLCDICREHPRFYNFSGRVCEVGIGAACEEAARIILTSDSYAESVLVSEEAEGEEYECEFDAPLEREAVYKILSDGRTPFEKRLSEIQEKYGVSPASFSDGEWRELISELEYLDESSKALFISYSSDSKPQNAEYSERALAYFIYRHTGESETREQFCISLGAALFMERLFSSIFTEDDLSEYGAAFALRRISEEIEYSEDNLERIKTEYL